MSRRLLTTFVVVLTCGATTAFVSAQKNAVPQTPWGEPDLQGTWTNQTLTPLERPANMANKQFYTKDEAAAAEKRAAEQRLSGEDAPPRPGDVGTYNRFWAEPGTRIVGSLATSLVVEPADGRVPLQRSAEQRRDDYLAHESDSFDFMSPWDRCITRGIPGAFFPAGYNNAYQIVQSRGYVVIHYEMIHAARVIPTDGRSASARRRCGSGTAIQWVTGKATRSLSTSRITTAKDGSPPTVRPAASKAFRKATPCTSSNALRVRTRIPSTTA